LDRPTTKALSYAEWSTPPKVVYPTDVLPKRIQVIKIDPIPNEGNPVT
jgi:hypothetical protein